MKRALALGLLLGMMLGLCATLTLRSQSAHADAALGTALSATAIIEQGSWRRLPDAGFQYSVCGHAQDATGLNIYQFRPIDGGTQWTGPCDDDCEPGAWANAPATCVAQWKSNRGL